MMYNETVEGKNNCNNSVEL